MKCNTLAYLGHPQVVSKLMCCEKGSLDYIHNNVFSMLLRNMSNKPECLSLATHSSCVKYNTLAYLAHPQVVSKLMCCEKGSLDYIHNNVFSL